MLAPTIDDEDVQLGERLGSKSKFGEIRRIANMPTKCIKLIPISTTEDSDRAEDEWHWSFAFAELKIIKRLRERLLGRDLNFVRSHGDFIGHPRFFLNELTNDQISNPPELSVGVIMDLWETDLKSFITNESNAGICSTPEWWHSIIVQALAAMAIMHGTANVVHNDCHYKNVLLRPMLFNAIVYHVDDFSAVVVDQNACRGSRIVGLCDFSKSYVVKTPKIIGKRLAFCQREYERYAHDVNWLFDLLTDMREMPDSVVADVCSTWNELVDEFSTRFVRKQFESPTSTPSKDMLLRLARQWSMIKPAWMPAASNEYHCAVEF